MNLKTPEMKQENIYRRAINEFLNPKAGDKKRSYHLFRRKAIGVGKRMTQTNPKELENQLPQEKE